MHYAQLRQAERGAGEAGLLGAAAVAVEADAFFQRVQDGKARPSFCTVFTCNSSKHPCNLQQEFWFDGRENPQAQDDPTKEYTIVHVHYHDQVRTYGSSEDKTDQLLRFLQERGERAFR